MPKKLIPLAVMMTVLIIALTGCNLPFAGGSSDPGLFYTQAASTIIAEMTFAVVETKVAEKTQEAMATSTPTLTNTPVATETPTTAPTATATPVPPTKTPVPNPCNAMQFISDITVEDGEIMAPNEGFYKVWRLQNIGTCTWTTDYDLVFVDGDQMDGDDTIALTNNVSPGRSIDVSVYLTAPSTKGTYTGYWMLRSSGGSYFGWGPGGEDAFFVTINVKKGASSSSTSDTPYDFYDNYCDAEWSNEDNDLPCPGDSGSEDGYVTYVRYPWLEKGGKDNEPAIVVHPEYVKNGEITGKFPPIEIDDGDRLVAAIGCMKDEEDCDVDFSIKYRDEDGKVDTLGTWHEEYDKKVTSINIDLSSLAGQDIIFYFIVETNGSYKGDTVFWLAPAIID